MSKVTLVSYSTPSAEMIALGVNTPMDLVAYCAKVSSSSQTDLSTATKLVNYLKGHRHWSPFEMVNMCVEVITTRDIARQLLRHRSFHFQEFSQRYAEVSLNIDDFAIREARLQDAKNRQNSIEIEDSELQKQWEAYQRESIKTAISAYEWALSKGIAKEQARCVLPEGNTPSKLYANATLRDWIHYLDLRTGNGTQKEHILMARQCAVVVNKLFGDF